MAICRRGSAYRVELYYFQLKFIGEVEIPTREEMRITRGATVLWSSPEAKYFSQADLLLAGGEVHAFEAWPLRFVGIYDPPHPCDGATEHVWRFP